MVKPSLSKGIFDSHLDDWNAMAPQFTDLVLSTILVTEIVP